MAYAHCHNCGWQQDDWWSEHYTPLDYDELKRFNEMLMEAVNNSHLRMSGEHDSKWLGERFGVRHEVDVRALVATELERIAQKIRNMYFWTEEDFYTNKHCPNCGSHEHMDVD
jgi:hypothetical protein